MNSLSTTQSISSSIRECSSEFHSQPRRDPHTRRIRPPYHNPMIPVASARSVLVSSVLVYSSAFVYADIVYVQLTRCRRLPLYPYLLCTLRVVAYACLLRTVLYCALPSTSFGVIYPTTIIVSVVLSPPRCRLHLLRLGQSD